MADGTPGAPRHLRIAVACGGTGGHTFPGLATGRELASRGHAVEVLAAGRSIEAATLKGWDGPVFRTGARPGKNPVAIVRALLRTIRHFRAERPDVLLAMGSYASLPPVLAARLLGVPVVLHEANAVPGKSNVFLSRFASAVATSFPGGEGEFRCARVVRTGLPVRLELLGQPPFGGFAGPAADEGLTVFVTGGSQGAVPLNDRASAALAEVVQSGRIPGLRVIHQTGDRLGTFEATRRRYEEAGVTASVSPFLAEMGGAFKVADLVIARAGAATCAEICLFGVPSILVPLPIAVRDHQYLNARHLADAGAAVVVRQDACTPEWLAGTLAKLAADRARLASMRAAALALAAPDATSKLADLVVGSAH